MTFSLGPRARSAGYQFAAFDQVGSTGAAEAMFRSRDGGRAPMWFATLEQRAGRGRHHRPWIARRSNFAGRIIEAMEGAPAMAGTWGFAARPALGMLLQRVGVEASLRAAGSDHMKFSLKWPNDVLAEDRQLAGLLREGEGGTDDRLAVVAGMSAAGGGKHVPISAGDLYFGSAATAGAA